MHDHDGNTGFDVLRHHAHIQRVCVQCRLPRGHGHERERLGAHGGTERPGKYRGHLHVSAEYERKGGNLHAWLHGRRKLDAARVRTSPGKYAQQRHNDGGNH